MQEASLDQDRPGRGLVARPGAWTAQGQHQGYGGSKELQRRKNGLNRSPDRSVAAGALLGVVKRRPPLRGFGVLDMEPTPIRLAESPEVGRLKRQEKLTESSAAD